MLVVVDLPVEYDVDRTILVDHRLVAAGHVDDAEPAHPDRDAGSDVVATVVGAAVSNRVAHPAKPLRGIRPIGRLTHKAGYPAHDGPIGSAGAARSATGVEPGPPEHELVAADGPTTGRHVGHLQPMPTPELKNLLGLRDLERIAAEPVEPIIDDRHAPARAVLGVT